MHGIADAMDFLLKLVIFTFLFLIIGGGWYLKSNSDNYKAEIRALKEQVVLCERKIK